MTNNVRLMCALALSALALSAQTIPISSTVETTGMVGLAEGQAAQLNLLNPGVQPPAVGVICSATVAFVDAAGTVLKSQVVSVLPGKAGAADLRGDTDLKLAAGDRREIRATITIPAFPPPPTATSTTMVPVACKLFPTLEIFDLASGRTLVTLGHVEIVPGPVTPTPATPNP
jgi:hypothetical protein